MCSLELLTDEKWLFTNQDENIKKFNPGYIRYGINFHRGGFDRMIKESIRDFFWMGDTQKWDRQLSHIKEANLLRAKGLRNYHIIHKQDDVWNQFKDCLRRAAEFIEHHPLLLPDGTVVSFNRTRKSVIDQDFDGEFEIQRPGEQKVVRAGWAQMSGDGLTTSNNCIVHDFYGNYLSIMACPNATDEEILDQAQNKYGDDILAGQTNQFGKLRDEEFVREGYSHFGLSVKPGTFKSQDSPIGMEFLGATVHSVKIQSTNYFIPAYKRDRILSGLQISCDPLDGDDELMKAFSLLELGWYDCYDEITSYIRYLFNHLPDTPVKRSFLSTGIPSRMEIVESWAGVNY